MDAGGRDYLRGRTESHFFFPLPQNLFARTDASSSSHGGFLGNNGVSLRQRTIPSQKPVSLSCGTGRFCFPNLRLVMDLPSRILRPNLPSPLTWELSDMAIMPNLASVQAEPHVGRIRHVPEKSMEAPALKGMLTTWQGMTRHEVWAGSVFSCWRSNVPLQFSFFLSCLG
jgi:hypothetical protein